MSNTEITPEIIKLDGQQPGPTVAIFAGIHGNEPVGIRALLELIKTLSITSGTLYLAFGNPRAIEQNVRFTEKNLNRCLVAGNTGVTYEDGRARELMAVLDRCDVLLDLHAFNEPSGEPICEDNALEVAVKLGPSIISTNWATAEPGATDAYMFNAGKVGICVECGPLSQPEAYKDMAITTVRQFLKYYSMINTDVEFSSEPKRIIAAERSELRTSEDFYLDSSLITFQKLTEGQILGSQDGREFVAKQDEYIIFPRPQAPIGGEAFIIGREA